MRGVCKPDPAKVRERNSDLETSLGSAVGFFKPVVREAFVPPPTGVSPYSPPTWTGPSQYTLGGVVPLQLPVGHSETVSIALDVIRAYPNGFELHFVVATRLPLPTAFAGSWPPWEPGRSADPLRIGFEFANGRCAGEEYYDIFGEPKDQDGLPYVPIILLDGAMSGSHRLSLRAWCWPLPPIGPITIYVEWEERGLAEKQVQVAGEIILAAAEAGVSVWQGK